jgi:hypothetical protein
MKLVRHTELITVYASATYPTDWDFLKGFTVTCPMNLPRLLKGNLPQNADITIPLTHTLADKSFHYSTLMSELFDTAVYPYNSLEKRNWLCGTCLALFIGEHLHLWWLEVKRKGQLSMLTCSFVCAYLLVDALQRASKSRWIAGMLITQAPSSFLEIKVFCIGMDTTAGLKHTRCTMPRVSM